MNRYNCTYRNDFGDVYPADVVDDPQGDYVLYEDAAADITRLTDERDDARDLFAWLVAETERLTAERDEARALAVWAIKKAAYGLIDVWRSSVGLPTKDDYYEFEHDGTDAGILDALRRAKEASNDH